MGIASWRQRGVNGAYTEAKGTHYFEGKDEDYADLFQFVRRNTMLLDGFDAVGQVGVVFSHAAWRKNRKAAGAVAECLFNANVPFALVGAGDDLLPMTLSERALEAFEKIVITSDADLDVTQQAVLDKSGLGGKLVVWKDAATLLDAIRSWVRVEGATGIWVLPRRAAGRSDSPLVVHLLNRNYDFATDKVEPQRNFTVRLAPGLLRGGTPSRCQLFAPGAAPVDVAVETTVDGVVLRVAEAGLWSVLRLE